MKYSKIRFLQIAIFFLSVISFCQKNNETNAAVEYNKFENLSDSNQREAFKALKKAKKFIDLAIIHQDTKDSQRTLLYKGNIYFQLLFGKYKYPELFPEAPDDAFDLAVDAWKRGYPISNKYQYRIVEAVNKANIAVSYIAHESFDKEQYYEAMLCYEQSYRLYDAINIIDSGSIYNAGHCAELIGNVDNAIKYYKICIDNKYKESDLSLKLANLLISANRKDEALEYLLMASSFNPNEESIHNSIGAIYIEQGKNDKALESLLRAINIDPYYGEAQYQLGSLYYNQGSALREQALSLGEDHVEYYESIRRSNEFYKKAIVHLEIYLRSSPTDKTVLSAMITLYTNLNDQAKVNQYTQRLDRIN